MEKIEGVNIRRRTIIINKEWRTEKGWEYLEREILTLGGDEKNGKEKGTIIGGGKYLVSRGSEGQKRKKSKLFREGKKSIKERTI